jgi:peptidoglycan/LPS O-acetylase OafA/YrhL
MSVGIAVLATVGFHWNLQLMPGALVGVDVFFMI